MRRLSASSLRTLAALVLFAYLVVVRTRHISETFWMLGDQILYWRIAFLPWNELPIGGGPSSVGGTTLGPAFVWTVWGIRHLVGPWVDNLPHAGGIGLSIIQSAADAFLLLAIWRRFASAALAVAVTLLIASAPYDMALTATIWNPPLSVALIKLAIGFAMYQHRERSIWWGIGATGCAILAVQSHSSAVFFAGPLVAALAYAERRDRLITYLTLAAAVTLVLEAPFLIDLAGNPGKQTSPPVVVDNIRYTIDHPEAIRPRAAFAAVADASAFILLRPWGTGWFGPLLLASAFAAAVRLRRDPTLLAITAAPLLCAGIGFSFWQRAYDHYWFLTVAPSAALTIAMALTAWQPIAPAVATCLALAVVAAQPWRVADAQTLHRLPEYGPLVDGSQEIRRRTAEVRGIDTEFDLPPSVDRQFIFEILGGRITPTAPFAATIERTGRVRYRPVE